MTREIFISVKHTVDKYKNTKRRLNVSGVLKILGVSRSGYTSFLKRKPSKNDIRKAKIVDKIVEKLLKFMVIHTKIMVHLK